MIGACVGGRLVEGLEIVSSRTLASIAVAAMAAILCGCAAPQGAPPVAAAPSGGCTVDPMKICAQAQAAGALEAAPAPRGMGATQAAMPRTARVEIPGGPTVQAMCYYDPQHNSVTRADWTATATLDAKAIAYLQSKKLCAGP
jgi:hypothetical protein